MYDFIRRLFLIASIILKLNSGISDYISSQKATKYSNPSIQHYMQSVSQVNNALCLATDRQALVTYENPEENLHNYWLHKSAIHAYKTSKFHAYENFTDLPVAILKEYETVSEALVGRILDETDSMDVMTLEGNETAALGNTSVDVIVRKYFYFKSKYYQDINKWYYDIVFNMRKFFKDKHKYGPAPFLRHSIVDTFRILDAERDIDAQFNNLGVRLRDKISTHVKSFRIRFYYALNQIMSERENQKEKVNARRTTHHEQYPNVPEFREVILFAIEH